VLSSELIVYKTLSRNNVKNARIPTTSFFPQCINDIRVADGTHQTPRNHNWHLNVCPAVAPRRVSQLVKNIGVSCPQQGCLASRRRVLQIAWQLVKGS
jgi:hypothetical protein